MQPEAEDEDEDDDEDMDMETDESDQENDEEEPPPLPPGPPPPPQHGEVPASTVPYCKTHRIYLVTLLCLGYTSRTSCTLYCNFFSVFAFMDTSRGLAIILAP